MDKAVTVKGPEFSIVNLPGRPPFMLDQALAVIYGVQVKRINEAVKRNPKRFPSDFCFQLTEVEWENLRSQIGTSSCDEQGLRSQSVTAKDTSKIRFAPYAFTREGANQLSTVLHSDVAIDRSIQIMRAFSKMEELSQAEMKRQARAIKRQGERDWQENRTISKEQRKELTNTIRDILLPHARNLGSTAPDDKLYLSYSKMIKSNLFDRAGSMPKDYRDQLTVRQLQVIAVAESIADGIIQEEVDKGTPYKGKDGIFEQVKARIIQYAATVGVLRLGEPERLAIGKKRTAALGAHGNEMMLDTMLSDQRGIDITTTNATITHP